MRKLGWREAADMGYKAKCDHTMPRSPRVLKKKGRHSPPRALASSLLGRVCSRTYKDLRLTIALHPAHHAPCTVYRSRCAPRACFSSFTAPRSPALHSPLSE